MSSKLNDIIKHTLEAVKAHSAASTQVEFDLLVESSSDQGLMVTPTLGEHREGSRIKFKISTHMLK